MAAEAEATREAKAKIIAAEGEWKASRSLKEAADVINESSSALQLRYLQTLNTIAAEKNSTIIFPLPIDLLASFAPKHRRHRDDDDNDDDDDYEDDRRHHKERQTPNGDLEERKCHFAHSSSSEVVRLTTVNLQHHEGQRLRPEAPPYSQDGADVILAHPT